MSPGWRLGSTAPQTLVIHTNSYYQSHGLVFMHSGIRALHLDLDHWSPAEAFFRTIADKVPNLTKLHIRLNSSISRAGHAHSIYYHEGPLYHLLNSLQDLQELSLPRFWFTTSIASVLMGHPNLKRILMPTKRPVQSGIPEVSGHPLETLGFDFMHPGPLRPFIPLRELHLSVPYHIFRRFLIQWVSAASGTGLTKLSLLSQVAESPDNLRLLCSILELLCPRIVSLHISSTRSTFLMPEFSPCLYAKGGTHDRVWDLEQLLPYRITLSDIISLSSLKELEDLELHHHLPAAFSSEDVEEIAKAFAHLSSLTLFPDPCLRSLPTSTEENEVFDDMVAGPDDFGRLRLLDLESTLRAFALHCPKLRVLHVFISAYSPDDATFQLEEVDSETSSSISDWSDPPVFQSLEKLGFGQSPCVGNSTCLAWILTEYVPLEVNIDLDLWTIWNSQTVYENRLEVGGVIPGRVIGEYHNIPKRLEDCKLPTTTASQNQNQSIGWDPKAPEPWELDQDGHLVPDEIAVVVNENGGPLRLDIKSLIREYTDNGTRIPGVAHRGTVRLQTTNALDKRLDRWRSVAEDLLIVGRMKKQESERAKRLTWMKWGITFYYFSTSRRTLLYRAFAWFNPSRFRTRDVLAQAFKSNE
ncbi:hypothetical protein BDN72DRAFT_858450 [Pluteus cervinus]|uniref:Uncharacterized protein n=1 Tax=Pluteus cervinus TaxID=181527 RepID=A0ACD3ASZ8_9AGAR|nr:hypothetical protein BDN72DRAFT_858450 [Pluteus cervinus]